MITAKSISKAVALLLSFVFVAVAGIALFACTGEGGKPASDVEGENDKKFPASESDGWVQTYTGGYKSVVHRVTSKENGNSIYGRIFYKDSVFDESEKYPLLIMSHGYNSQGVDGNNRMAQIAMDNGMIVYSYDFCGGGIMSKSEGETTEMSVETEISDLESVIEEISSLPYVDEEQVVLFASSFGGLVSGLTAARHKDDIAALMLQAPAFGGVVNKDNSPYNSLDEIPETVQNGEMLVGKIFYEDMWELYPYEELKGYDKRVLVMYGSEDTDQTPTIEAYNSRTMPESPSCDVIFLEGVGHNFVTKDYNAAEPDILAYLRKMGIVDVQAKA